MRKYWNTATQMIVLFLVTASLPLVLRLVPDGSFAWLGDFFDWLVAGVRWLIIAGSFAAAVFVPVAILLRKRCEPFTPVIVAVVSFVLWLIAFGVIASVLHSEAFASILATGSVWSFLGVGEQKRRRRRA